MIGVGEAKVRGAIQVVLARMYKRGDEVHGIDEVLSEFTKQLNKMEVKPIVNDGRVVGYEREPLLRTKEWRGGLLRTR